MSRKANYQLDYDDYGMYDYDDDEYDYDNDAGTGREVKPSRDVNKNSKLNVWRCSICTYDNDENLSFCDICGVLRDASAKSNRNGLEKANVAFQNHGVSTMAKSIFVPVISGISPESSDQFQHFKDGSQITFSKSTIPFKFDSPSPDDFVSAGKNASKNTKKGSSGNSASTSTSTSITEKNGVGITSSTAESFYNSSVVSSKMDDLIAGGSTNSTTDGDTSISSSSLQKLNQDEVSKDHVNPVVIRKTNDQSDYKPEKWMSDQEEGGPKQLNLAIVGHVDSGKSTLSGRLLHLLGHVSQKEMHKYEKEAKEKGKGSFAYAWAMDESAEERERGVTMTVAVAYFDTKHYHVVLLDSPGHKDFVPNMISGATQADAAVLVIDASVGKFEAGMDGNGVGQTREHAQLIRSFGVEQVVVLVNKMDVVGYSKERFDFIKSQLSTFLRSCQFKESCLEWIPASAMENQNLLRAPSDSRLSSWYNGKCLLESIDSLNPPERDISKPLRMPICDVMGAHSHSSGHVAASGKLVTGAIRNGSKVLVMPSGILATVRFIERNSQKCSVARAGDNVTITLQDVDASNLMSGDILCHPDFPVSVGTSLELKIFVLDVTTPIVVGSHVEFHTHHAKEAGRITKIVSVLDQKSKKASKKAPRFLTAKQSAVIEVVLERAVCVEEFSSCRALGRAFLRASGNTIALGTISKVIDRQ